jgi:hypothetical protein
MVELVRGFGRLSPNGAGDEPGTVAATAHPELVEGSKGGERADPD